MSEPRLSKAADEFVLHLPTDFSIDEMHSAVERELTYRLRVYPRWVDEKRMTPAFAHRQIETFRALLAVLQQMREHGDLFREGVEAPKASRAPSGGREA